MNASSGGPDLEEVNEVVDQRRPRALRVVVGQIGLDRLRRKETRRQHAVLSAARPQGSSRRSGRREVLRVRLAFMKS